MSPPTSIRSSLADALTGWPPPVLDPAGPFSERITTLSWALLAMAVLVMVVVGFALASALFGSPALKKRLGGRRLIWGAGFAFPVVVLTGLLVWGLTLTSSLSSRPTGDELRIQVTGEMWWWRVTYLDADGRVIAQDANEVHIPVGRPVLFELTSNDVIHSFWVPQLAGKLDMVPGRVNRLRLTADQPGSYGGQCAEYCGGPHALMGLVVVAHAPEDFEREMVRLRAPASAPATQVAMRGADVFETSGCGACHTITGTSANGLAGPDLSHVGGRRSLGAGILPNNQGTLAGWIADSQTIKPGNRMPSYSVLSGEELMAVSAYLDGLE